MQITSAFYRLAVVFSAFVLISDAVAQTNSDRAVKQASFNREPSGVHPQEVRFTQRAARVGDELEQTNALEVNLTMSMRQANELIGKHQTNMHADQRRVATTINVDKGCVTAVKVRYPVATRQTSNSDAGEAPPEPATTKQPVQGKTYICRRDPVANSELVITDEVGNRPPTDEYEIVSQQMQMVGRPNPLAQFLASRTFAVGEKVEVPNEVASQIFNLGERFGKVSRFTLTLRKVQSENNVPCAEFLAKVEAASHDATQMRLEVEGPLVVETSTCRAVRLSLAGPIGMSETRGTYSTAYQVIGTGRMQLNVASLYREVQQ